jgi:hypothetical protein
LGVGVGVGVGVGAGPGSGVGFGDGSGDGFVGPGSGLGSGLGAGLGSGSGFGVGSDGAGDGSAPGVVDVDSCGGSVGSVGDFLSVPQAIKQAIATAAVQMRRFKAAGVKQDPNPRARARSGRAPV